MYERREYFYFKKAMKMQTSDGRAKSIDERSIKMKNFKVNSLLRWMKMFVGLHFLQTQIFFFANTPCKIIHGSSLHPIDPEPVAVECSFVGKCCDFILFARGRGSKKAQNCVRT